MNSFRKAYFEREAISQATADIVESDLEDISTIDPLLDEMDDKIDANDYVSFDTDLPTSEPSVAEDSYDAKIEIEDEYDEDNDVEFIPPSSKKAINAMDLFRNYHYYYNFISH